MDKLLKESRYSVRFMIPESMFKELHDHLKEKKIYIDEFTFKDNIISGEINTGDWKHEHLYAVYTIANFFGDRGIHVEHDQWTTDSDGSDCYSAKHIWRLFSKNPDLEPDEPIELELQEPKYIKEDAIDSLSNVSATTVEDILAGMIGNCSDREIDEALKMFTKIAKVLGVSDYADLQVLAHDGDYDLKSFDTMFTFASDVYRTRDVKLFVIDENGSDAFKAVQEVLPGGSYFIYAKDVLTLDHIVQAVEKYNNGNAEEVLDETTQRQLDNREKTLYNNIRKRLDTNDLMGTREQWTDAEKQEYSEIRCISMIHSILAYAGEYNYNVKYVMSNRYLKRYIDELGEDRVKVLAAEEIEEFKKATVKFGGTDSEGVSYNQVIFKESSDSSTYDNMEVYVPGDDIPANWYSKKSYQDFINQDPDKTKDWIDFNMLVNEWIPDEIRPNINDPFNLDSDEWEMLADKYPNQFRNKKEPVTEEMTDLVHDEWEQPDVDVAVFVKGEYQIKKLSDDDADKETWEVMHFKGDTNEGTSMGKCDSLADAKKKADDDAKKSEPKNVTEANIAGLKIFAKNLKVGDKFVSSKSAVDEYMPHKTYTVTDIEDIGKDELMIKFVSDEGEERDKVVDMTTLIGFVPKSDITESTDSEYETRKNNYLKAKADFEKHGEENNNDVLSREEKMRIAKAEFEKVGGSINEEYDPKDTEFNDKYFPRVDLNDDNIHYYKLDGSEYAYDMKNAVVMFLFKDEDEVEHFGIDEAPYRVLDTVGLSRDNWNDRAERDEYLRGYKQDLDDESSYLVQDFIQNELPYYQKQSEEN